MIKITKQHLLISDISIREILRQSDKAHCKQAQDDKYAYLFVNWVFENSVKIINCKLKIVSGRLLT